MLSLPTILLILAALSLGATVIAVMIALRSQREASSAIFPIVREEETLRARRARLSIFVWIAVTALFLGGWLATLRQNGASSEMAASTSPESSSSESSPDNQPTLASIAVVALTDTPLPPSESTATPTPGSVIVKLVESPTVTNTPLPLDTSTPTPVPTLTPVPATSTLTPIPEPSATFTLTPLPTNTPLPPTATPEPSPTPTKTPVPPTPTPTRVVIVPQVAATTPPRTPAPQGIRVGPIQFATEITPSYEPINPKTTFPKEVKSIYAVYQTSGIKKGLPIRVIWYQNGVELAREEGIWEWGTSDRSFTFLGPRGEGLYKLELYVNDSIVATSLFEIK
jgi:hypothetical protein